MSLQSYFYLSACSQRGFKFCSLAPFGLNPRHRQLDRGNSLLFAEESCSGKLLRYQFMSLHPNFYLSACSQRGFRFFSLPNFGPNPRTLSPRPAQQLANAQVPQLFPGKLFWEIAEISVYVLTIQFLSQRVFLAGLQILQPCNYWTQPKTSSAGPRQQLAIC